MTEGGCCWPSERIGVLGAVEAGPLRGAPARAGAASTAPARADGGAWPAGRGQKESDPGNERARFHTAAGSASEVRLALQVAVAWGYFAEKEAVPALALVDRVVAMLWRLSRR